jgi:rare lipoprotein A (peptidoglycan hydrolase)
VRLRALLVLLALGLLTAGPAHAYTLGERTLKKGHRGSDVVTLQRVLSLKGYAVGAADGVFGRRTKRAVKRHQRRRGIKADGVVGPMTTKALAYTWEVRSATLYGPGLYGNRTACGQTLAHRTRGIAHRSLPCGKRVPIYHAGRIAIFPVIDRGPYARGVSLDLTAAAARKVGMSTTTSVRAGY